VNSEAISFNIYIECFESCMGQDVEPGLGGRAATPLHAVRRVLLGQHPVLSALGPGEAPQVMNFNLNTEGAP
jgi:hypothetical protein